MGTEDLGFPDEYTEHGAARDRKQSEIGPDNTETYGTSPEDEGEVRHDSSGLLNEDGEIDAGELLDGVK